MLVLALVLALGGCRHSPPTATASGPPREGTFDASPDARVWYLRSVAAEVRGDMDEARRALEWVTRLDRQSPWPWVARARLSERMGELPNALLSYGKALHMHPLPEAHLGRARVYLRLHDVELAQEDLAVAVEAGLLTAEEAAELGSLADGCSPELGPWLEARAWPQAAEWAALVAEASPGAPGCATDP